MPAWFLAVPYILRPDSRSRHISSHTDIRYRFLPGCYEVAEGGVVPEPGEPEPTLEEQLAALESSNNDIILMLADLIGG